MKAQAMLRSSSCGQRHIHHSKLCTLVTARFAGGSYLNKVELQNGCLALGHSNLFIPSTINGSNFDSNGKLDKTQLKQNLGATIDVYISAVDGSHVEVNQHTC